jgi:hypothetical protein
VKFVFSLLLASAVLLAGCNTNATRRDLYAPAKANGPYSDALKDSSYRYGVKQRKKKATTPAPAGGTQKKPASTQTTPASDAALPSSAQ